MEGCLAEELIDLALESAVAGPPDEGDDSWILKGLLKKERRSMMNWKGNFFIRYELVNNFYAPRGRKHQRDSATILCFLRVSGWLLILSLTSFRSRHSH